MSNKPLPSLWPRCSEVPIISSTHNGNAPPSYRATQEPFQATPRRLSHGLGIANLPSHVAPEQLPSPGGDKKENKKPNDIAGWLERGPLEPNSSWSIWMGWFFEIVSWTISALSVGAIIVILAILSNKELPSWPVNFILNCLSRIVSAALILPVSEAIGQLKWNWFQKNSTEMRDFEIFDKSSRGPWGSILLLIRTKGRTLASLGAAVTLLAVALDPCFQQLVDFPGRNVQVGQSFIPRVTYYDPDFDTLLSAGRRVAEQDEDAQKAADKFFYGNGTQPVPYGNVTRAEIPLSCPTSNCTWEPYESLGTCSSCVDVSQLLSFSCRFASIDWASNITGANPEAFTYPNGTACGYFINATSHAPVLMSGYSIDPPLSAKAGTVHAREALLMRALPLATFPARQPLFGGSINFKHIRDPIFDVIIAGVNNIEDAYHNITPTAHECVLAWCVKTIQSSYFQASYQETIIKETLNTTAGRFPFNSTHIEGEGTFLTYRDNITIKAPTEGSNSSIYGLSADTAVQFITIFDDIFPSFLNNKNSSTIPLLRYKTGEISPTQRRLKFNPWVPPNNLTLHMERLSTALTNAIRSGSSTQAFLGKAYDKETFVLVKWEWLTLPLFILLLTLIFLVATIRKSLEEKDRVGIWKTSALATLLYADEMQQKKGSRSFATTPRSKTKAFRAKMFPNQGRRTSQTHSTLLPPHMGRNQAPPGWI